MNFQVAFIVIFIIIVPILFQIIKLSFDVQKQFKKIINELELINKKLIQ